MPRPIRLNAFDMNCVAHQSPGLWRHPDDRAWDYRKLSYWTDLAMMLDVDGFNLAYAITPGTFIDAVEHLIPELQRRGVAPTSYPPGTLREKLFDGGPRLPESHPGAAFRRLGEPLSAGAAA